ncbi:MAG: AAA family ATPase [Saprospiraceae bacterium]|nr:AAA family ATPase [Saprospiraceae bacterium]
MKILKIRSKNIHSLKGEQEVDFTISPLVDAGLFAITGPTGSGKSTLLDIITLALFNQIPRFDRKITTSEIEKAGSVITHHTLDAYAEVDYQANGKIYRSTWSIARTRTGNLKDYDMTLATIPDNTYLDLKKSMVPDENEKIIGLNYEQFIRSILLSQGEFAKFLRSDEKERAKLLEDITGTQIYREIGKAAFRKSKECAERINLMNAEIRSCQIADKESIQTKRDRRTEISTEIADINKFLPGLKDEQAAIIRLKETEKKKAQLLQQWNVLEESQNNFEAKLKALGQHEKLAPYRDRIVELQSEKSGILTLEKDIEDFNVQLELSKTDLQKIFTDVSKFAGQDVDQSSFSEVLQIFEREILKLEQQMLEYTESGKKVRDNLNRLYAEADFGITVKLRETGSPDLQLNIALTRKDELSEIFQPEEQNKSISQYQSELEQLSVEAEKLTEQLRQLKQKQDIESEINVLSEGYKKSLDDKIKLEFQLQTPEEKLPVLKVEIERLKIENEKSYKVASLEKQRELLTEGEACPLCGSLDHPYRVHSALTSLGEVALSLKNAEKDLEETTKILTKLKADIAGLEGSINAVQTQINLKKSSLEKLINTINPEYINTGLEFLKEMLVGKQKALTDIKIKISSQYELIFLKEAIHIINELNNILRDYKVTSEKKNAEYVGKNITSDILSFRTNYEKSQHQITTTETGLKIKSEALKIANAKVDGLNESLTEPLKNLGYGSVEDAARYLLDEKTLESIRNEKSELAQKRSGLNASMADVETMIETLLKIIQPDTEISQLMQKISEYETKRDQLNVETGEIDNYLKNHEQQLAQLTEKKDLLLKFENESRKWILLNHYIGDAEGNKYAKFAQQLSLKHLVTLANNRLLHLSDRYTLVSDNTESADLKISDAYQGGISRSVKTLSGGESFLISLALALSLSDMASKNVKLESLFIDEGFGTLDAETLDLALSTLEKLQSESNRTIGIISHVDALKERIYTQVQIEKNNLGYSKINVVG